MPATVSDDLVEQRILEAYARAASRAVVTGWAALRLHGGGFFDGLSRDGRTRLPVPIAANRERIEARAGTQVQRCEVPPDEVVVIHGMRCASVERALFDEMRRHRDLREMAVAADMACAARLTTLKVMRSYCATRRWYRDVRVVAGALEMSDEHSRSPQESRFRMIWEYDAGWDRPLCNRPVLDVTGRLIGVPDLLDPARGIVGEYAGAEHRDIERHEHDIAREAALRAVGLEYVEVVARDLRDHGLVVRRMKEAESRAGLLPQRWVLGPDLPSSDVDRLTSGPRTSHFPSLDEK